MAALAAIDRGKHVYCEKSISHTEEGLYEVYDTVRNSDRVFQLGHQITQNVVFQQAKEIIKRNIKKPNGIILVTGPTGSGKTESAFLWVEKQLQIFGQGRVFYILPFTASINAMYERLNNDINNVVDKVGLVHGKLAEYVEGKFSEDDYSESNEKKKNDIIEAFKTLITPVKVTTPFQLLKHIFGLKGFEKGLFEWTGAYFIFDEI